MEIWIWAVDGIFGMVQNIVHLIKWKHRMWDGFPEAYQYFSSLQRMD